MADNKMTQEQLDIEYKSMLSNVEHGIVKLSHREAIRLLLVLLSKDADEVKYLKRLKSDISKHMYVFSSKLLSIKYASLYSKILQEQNKKEGETK